MLPSDPSISTSVSGNGSTAEPGRIAAIDDRGDAVLVVEQDGRDVLAADRRIDPPRARGQPRDVAEQEARDVENMNAEILDDETLAVRRDRAGR